MSRPDTKYRPPRKLPVASLIQPIIAGPAKPPRLPIELIVAMPAAAADPDRNVVGMAQSGGFAELMPMLTKARAATTDIHEPANAARVSPAAAAKHAATTCQVRS